ncbi:MAG: bifunctional 5,10-methylenetetrahydrofolate dehydrogenase/5,10-methenyltetrahydrofolate cyclohydrolase [Candidatus Nealsonbacteria bacterium]
MKIFNGKKEAEKIISRLGKKVKKLKNNPKLAVIWVGDNASSEIFIRNKKKTGREAGIKISVYRFKKTAKEEAIIQKIDKLNKDVSVNGIIVQLPLPKGFNPGKIIREIEKEKDIDGFSRGRNYFDPPLPKAIVVSLKKGEKSFKGKKIISLVNSDIFGKSLRDFLEKNKIKSEYLLNSNFKKDKLKSADIIITVLGRPKTIKGDMIKRGAVLVDAGITVTREGKIVGDVDRKSVSEMARFLTPVPGGVGPLNVVFLLENLYLSYIKHGHI